MKTLSKSKLLAYRQCPKRLWLEVHETELSVYSKAAQARFDTGKQVGSMARRLYDPDETGTLLDRDVLGMSALLSKTKELLKERRPSWSIKDVLPTVAAELRYDELEGVQDGGGAQAAFLEAVHPDTPAICAQEIGRQLWRYCRLDTFAMVRLWAHLAGRKQFISPIDIAESPHAPD